jgi:transcription termination/antitermination protein NusG
LVKFCPSHFHSVQNNKAGIASDFCDAADSQEYTEGHVTQPSGAMINVVQGPEAPTSLLFPEVNNRPRWYAVQTRPRYEKKVYSTLISAGLHGFLPLTKEVHRWSDRRAVVQVPIFPCYLFVRIVPFGENRILVLRASGAIGFVGMHGHGIPIPDEQIENLRILATNNMTTYAYPFLKLGQRVRIRGGCLEGIQGILLAREGDRKVVVSVDAIQRSLVFSITGYDIEPV